MRGAERVGSTGANFWPSNSQEGTQPPMILFDQIPSDASTVIPLLFLLEVTSVILDQKYQQNLRNLLDMQVLGPNPDLLNQKLWR